MNGEGEESTIWTVCTVCGAVIADTQKHEDYETERVAQAAGRGEG